MAAGNGKRFGGLKQFEEIDKQGNFLVDYTFDMYIVSDLIFVDILSDMFTLVTLPFKYIIYCAFSQYNKFKYTKFRFLIKYKLLYRYKSTTMLPQSLIIYIGSVNSNESISSFDVSPIARMISLMQST